MKTIIISFFTALISLPIIDTLWLGFIAKDFYRKHLGHIISETFKIVPALFFYPIYALGITLFVVLPAIQENFSFFKTFLFGFFFGLVVYAAYDFTNHATIKNWPTIVTIVDLAWGAFLAGTISVIALLIVKNFS